MFMGLCPQDVKTKPSMSKLSQVPLTNPPHPAVWVDIIIVIDGVVTRFAGCGICDTVCNDAATLHSHCRTCCSNYYMHETTHCPLLLYCCILQYGTFLM